MLAESLLASSKLSDDPATPTTVRESLTESLQAILATSDDQVYNRLLEGDITLLSDNIERLPLTVPVESVAEIGRHAVALLIEETGHETNASLQVFVVRQFPEPYDDVTSWDFLYADAEDHHKYGIPIGLYVHADRQFPFFSDFLIVHEYVHFFVDALKADRTKTRYRWMEEGFANWYGLLVYDRIRRDPSLVRFVQAVTSMYTTVLPFSTISEYVSYDRLFRLVYSAGGHEAIRTLFRAYTEDPLSDRWQQLFDDLRADRFESLRHFAAPHTPTRDIDFLLQREHEPLPILTVQPSEHVVLRALIDAGGPMCTSQFQHIGEDERDRAIEGLSNRGVLVREDGEVRIMDNLRGGLVREAVKARPPR